MKKTICILLTCAMLFAFAACSKKQGELYVEPPTEVITFADGETAVYEVVTDAAGEAVTDENGENEVVPYDPPVTEKGGYLVTDPEGSTIKQSATTVALTAAVENDDFDFEEVVNGTTAKADSAATTAKTDAAGSSDKTTAKPEENKTSVSSSGNSPLTPGEEITTAKAPSVTTTEKNTAVSVPSTQKETTTKNDSGAVKETTVADLPEGETGDFGTDISKADAQKLYDILDFENTFDAALCEADYYTAEKELEIYMANIENAVAQIKADKDLYQYVGNENLNLWLGYMNQAKEKYAIFMGIYRGVEHDDEYPKAFYSTYEDFQNSYRSSLKVYYSMLTGAQAIMYS